MALTRKFLQDLNLPGDVIDSIINEHAVTTNNLVNEIQTAKEGADAYAAAKKELDTLNDFKAKYETEKADHERLINEIDGAKAAKSKLDALTAYFESKNITGGNLQIALRGVSLDDIELDGEQIKDTGALDALVEGDFKPLVTADNGSKPGNTRRIDSGAKVGVNDHGGGNRILSLREALKAEYNTN